MTLRRTAVTAARPVPRPAARVEPLEARQVMSAVAPSDLEQYMLELVNRARANPAAEAARFDIDLNEGLPAGTISPTAKQPLAFNPAIVDAARRHSREMLDRDAFAHAGANGSTPGQRMAAAGYAAAGTFGWGENIAYRGSRPNPPPGPATTAAEHRDLFVDAGIPGRGHRTNLLNGAYKEVGVGIAAGDFNGYAALMSTQDFGYVTGNAFLTGVAFTDAVTADAFYTPGEGLGDVTVTAVRAGDGLTKSATTWASGGYALSVPAGTYAVTATGGTLAGPVRFDGVVVGTTNVKLDVRPPAASPPVPVPPIVLPPVVVPPVVVPPVTVPPVTPPAVPPPAAPADPTPAQPVDGTGEGTPGPVSPPAAPAGGIRGTIWADVNGNGRREKREPGAAGRTVFVDTNANGTFDAGEPAAVTDAAGGYQFAGLATGSHTVRVAAADGWRTTSPAGDAQPVGVAAAAAVARARPVGVTDRAVVGGIVFADLNGDGARGAAEPAFRKVKVFLDLDYDGARGKAEPVAKVDAAGRWRFAGLAAGAYSVRLVARPTLAVSAPAGGALSITAGAGADDSAAHAFGVMTPFPSAFAGRFR